jgi:hypothetical protein
MYYLIIRDDLINKYETGDFHGNEAMICDTMFSLHNFSCTKVGDAMFDTIRMLLGKNKYLEIDEQVAIDGTVFFSETREEIKTWEESDPHYPEYWEDDDRTIPISGSKSDPRPMTAQEKENTVIFMKLFAKEVVEEEFSRKYLALSDKSDLEIATWEIQKHEAREFLTYGEGDPDHVTPFLDYCASERELDKTTLSNKILVKAEEYQDKLSTMLVESQKILKKFEDCTTIWDLNIVYADYLGYLLPNNQAIALGRMNDDESQPGGSLLYTDGIVGNKLNF